MFKQTQPKGPYHQCTPRHAYEGEITFWGTLKEALNKHFDDKPWHFTISGHIFKSPGKTVQNVLSNKASFHFINKFTQ